ncbi:MAG: hypothetical protein HY000_38725 [Planctomycetes bacterium]|nr:hypothetical protein [Planctomycetota bacterium]
MDKTATTPTSSGLRRRHWFQFSLRTLLIVMLVIGVSLGLLVNRARRQREATSAILKAGGSVLYDYQKIADASKPNGFNPKAAPPGPDWLRNLVGAESFQEVVNVSLRDQPITDEDLEELEKLPKLEGLDLTNTQVTSAGLVHLAGLTTLRSLGLWNTQVDDAGLQHIAHLHRLWQLNLDGTRVTDAGLMYLGGLTNLEEWLGLADTEVTDAGLEHLTGLTKLRNLNLRLTKVTEAGVQKLHRSLPKTHISYGP